MDRSGLRSRTVFVAVFLSVAIINGTQAADHEGAELASLKDLELVGKLRTAYENWLTNADFKGTYDAFEIYADTSDLVFGTENWGDPVADGVVCRLGTYFRYRQSLAAAPLVDPTQQSVAGGDAAAHSLTQPTVQFTLAKVSADEATDGEILVSFKPAQGPVDSAVQVFILPPSAGETGRLPCVGNMASLQSPLKPLASCQNGFPQEPLPLSDEDYTATWIDEEHVRLKQERQKPGDSGSVEYEVDFWVTPETPGIVRVYRASKDESGEVSHTTEARLSDFRDCGGFQLAAEIVSSSGMRIRSQGGESRMRCQGKRWHADDLGDFAPTMSDFEIPLEENTYVMGLKEPEPVLSSRSINIMDLAASDLLMPGDPAPTVTPKFHERFEPPDHLRWWILNTIVIAAVVMCTLLFFRRRKIACD